MALEDDWLTVATGTWRHDGVAPRSIAITRRPAEHASSRFTVDEELDPSRPIPVTPDGFVYRVGATGGGDFHALEDAKAWADAQPWGPVAWD